MAGIGNLAQMIQAYDAATGQNLNPNAPWTGGGPGGWDANGAHAAFNNWMQQQTGSVPDYGTAAQQGGVQTNRVNPINAQTFTQYSPQTIQGQFPNGLPQLSASQIMGVPQVSPQAIGGMPQVRAQQIGGLPQAFAPQIGQTPNISAQTIQGLPNVNAQQLGAPNSIIAGMGGPGAYSPANTEKAINAYMLPQFQQQNAAETAALANAGIVGGTSGKAMADLGSQQQTTLMNDIQPYLMQEQQLQQQGVTGDIANQIMTGQSNQSANLQGQEANLSAQLAAAQSNQGANLSAQQSNQSTQLQTKIQQAAMQLQAQGMNMQQALQVATTNAANDLTAQGMDQQTAYQVASFNATQVLQAAGMNQQTSLQGQEYNANAMTGAQQFNIQQLMNTAGTDANTYNQQMQYIMGLQNQDYLGQLGQAGNIATAGLGATAGGFTPNYQQPAQVNLGGVASAFAPNASANNAGSGQGSFAYNNYNPLGSPTGYGSTGGIGNSSPPENYRGPL